MTEADLPQILPMIVISAAAVVVMLAIAFHRSHQLTMLLTLAGFAIPLVLLSQGVPSAALPSQVTPLMIVDRYSLFYTGLILAAAIAITLLSYSYLQRQEQDPEEFYLFLLLATLGSLVLVYSNHFVSFFVGLELLSIPLYVLIAYPSERKSAIEAGLKYLVLAGASSAFLLFGMALIYAESGSMEFPTLAVRLSTAAHGRVLLLSGFALMVTGVGFKLALVPFHMWTPDVYEGAPAPVTAFVATISKGAVFAVLMRYLFAVNAYRFRALFLVLTIVSIGSMVMGNLLALLQNNLKRVLAYSSIAHLGYLLVALLAGRELAVPASMYYLVAYFVSILSAFGVIGLLSGPDGDLDDIESYRGLFWRRPWMSAVFTATLLSLAGIPLTAGFVGKFYLMAAGVGSALWLLVLVLVGTSLVGLFYYLRIIVALYASTERTADEKVSVLGGLALAALMLFLVWLGIYPTPFMRLIQRSVAGLF